MSSFIIYTARAQYPCLYLQCIVHVYSAMQMGNVTVSAFSVYTSQAQCSALQTRSVYSAPDVPRSGLTMHNTVAKRTYLDDSTFYLDL